MMNLDTLNISLNNVVSYLQNNPDTISGLASEIIAVFENTNYSVEEAIEILEDSDFTEAVYSRYFNEDFNTIDDYNDCIKHNADDVNFYNLVKHEELTEFKALVVNGELFEIKDNQFHTAEQMLAYTLDELKNFINVAEDFNSIVENYNDGDIDMVEMLCQFREHEYSSMFCIFKFCNYEFLSGEHIDLYEKEIYPTINNMKSLLAARQLDRELAVKNEPIKQKLKI